MQNIARTSRKSALTGTELVKEVFPTKEEEVTGDAAATEVERKHKDNCEGESWTGTIRVKERWDRTVVVAFPFETDDTHEALLEGDEEEQGAIEK